MLAPMLAPGVLLAATGVGAGDLATAGFAGSRLGVAIAWAVVLGALVKFVLTEGLTRWQLATGRTLLEGVGERFGRAVLALFLLYLVAWSFFTGGALISACGASAQSVLGWFDDPSRGKLVFGAIQSVIALVLALVGGFRLFERVMSLCVGVMFLAVVVTGARLVTDWGALGLGLGVPRVPDAGGEGLGWTIALMGGVGGTVTILCYGYWIREIGREGPGALRACRLDLGVGYAMTALFGVAMLVIASGLETTGSGVGLILGLADQLGSTLGPGARWLFLIGVWAAVFSSMLGVWQAVPYLFADVLGMLARPAGRAPTPVSTRTLPYRGFAIALALVPIASVGASFETVQKAYAIVGACFLPMLALALLLMNGRTPWVGKSMRNRWWTVLFLVAALALSGIAGWAGLTR